MEVVTKSGQTLKLDGDYEQYVTSEGIQTRRVKEAEKVVVTKFPTITNLRTWHCDTGRGLVHASGRTDNWEIAWWNAILGDGVTFEDLENSGDARFAMLDIKLYTALKAIIRESCKILLQKVEAKEQEMMPQMRTMKGRQLGWMIHDWFRVNPDMKPLYGLDEISSLKWMGDDHIFEFLTRWKDVTTNNALGLDRKQLATTLEGKIPVTSKAVGQDIIYY